MEPSSKTGEEALDQKPPLEKEVESKDKQPEVIDAKVNQDEAAKVNETKD